MDRGLLGWEWEGDTWKCRSHNKSLGVDEVGGESDITDEGNRDLDSEKSTVLEVLTEQVNGLGVL